MSTQQLAIVSCDIIGHSLERASDAQLKQLRAINDVVRGLLDRQNDGQIVWASRGDGGHVALAVPDWREAAVQLILDLLHWSASAEVPLRVIAHHGDVSLFAGADGRTELAGEAINLVGRLIWYAGPRRVVVSDAFVRAMGEEAPPGVRFHDPRTVLPKYFSPQVVHLLSHDDRLASAWDRAQDRDLLHSSVQCEEKGWDVVYYAKRLMQTNSSDGDAERALSDLGSDALQFRNHATGRREVNPVLGRVESYSRVEFVRASQLIEREDGELLCQSDDPGDTMFVILRGQIQVEQPGHPPVVRRPGDLVGELAFALHRNRTAAMRCLGHAALLGFTYQHLDAQFHKSPAGTQSKEELDRVLHSRILKYLCTTVSYLGSADPGSPLHEGRRPWEWLQRHTARLPVFEAGTVLSFADPHFEEDGIYLLVSGRLVGHHQPRHAFDGDELPVIYASFPDRFVSVNRLYRVERDATVICIRAAGFRPPGGSLGAAVLQGVSDAVKAACGQQYHYDAFVSYTFDDQEIVARWRDALERAGLRVFMDTAHLLRRFPEKIAAALLDSRVLLPLVSANTLRRQLDENWVRSEIEYRQTCFDRDAANILPVRLLGGNVATLADGFVSVDADGREAAAMNEVIETVRSVKDGRHPPPFATRRRHDVRLRTPS